MVYSNRRDHTLGGVRREQDVPILAVGIEAARGGAYFLVNVWGDVGILGSFRVVHVQQGAPTASLACSLLANSFPR